MKILIITDKNGTAIDRLARLIEQYNDRHEVKILPVHPKRTGQDTIIALKKLLEWCDILDIHYWKSGEKVRELYPDIFAEKKKILFHFNPYDLEHQNWNEDYSLVVVGNQYMQSKLPYAHLVPYGIDIEKFTLGPMTNSKRVQMVANRIEGKKGIDTVARACGELGYEFELVGNISKPEYMQEVMAIGNVNYIENASEDELIASYHRAAIHVCNSADDFESGTLPILEAMACGVPVLTRNVGHVPDLFDGKNMVVRTGSKESIEDLKDNLKALMENEEWRERIRQKARDTVRGRDSRKMVWDIFGLYNRLHRPGEHLVSIIMPTKNNHEAFAEALLKAARQDYKKIEIVVADSSAAPMKPIIDRVAEVTGVPIKYIWFGAPGYTLAEARNRAVIEARGSWLVFCDDRIGMEPNAVSEFMKYAQERRWLWGVKDDNAKPFIENFSCVQRQYVIIGGMFNERMQWYGGMSQEIRERFAAMNYELVQSAKAYQTAKAKSRQSRWHDIANAKLLIHKLYG